MKKFTIFLILFLTCVLSNSVNAQKKPFATKGVWEFGGTIGWSSITPVNNGTTGSATSLFLVQPLAGYFIAKSIELAIEPSILAYSYPNGSNTNMTLYFAPGYNFIFKKSRIYPSIHALIGYSSYHVSVTSTPSSTYSASGFSWGLAGGVKINLMGNSLLLFGVQYQQITQNPSGATSRTGNNIITLGAGWDVWF